LAALLYLYVIQNVTVSLSNEIFVHAIVCFGLAPVLTITTIFISVWTFLAFNVAVILGIILLYSRIFWFVGFRSKRRKIEGDLMVEVEKKNRRLLWRVCYYPLAALIVWMPVVIIGFINMKHSGVSLFVVQFIFVIFTPAVGVADAAVYMWTAELFKKRKEVFRPINTISDL